MNPSGTNFSGDKIVPGLDLRAGTASDRINVEYVNKNIRRGGGGGGKIRWPQAPPLLAKKKPSKGLF